MFRTTLGAYAGIYVLRRANAVPMSEFRRLVGSICCFTLAVKWLNLRVKCLGVFEVMWVKRAQYGEAYHLEYFITLVRNNAILNY